MSWLLLTIGSKSSLSHLRAQACPAQSPGEPRELQTPGGSEARFRAATVSVAEGQPPPWSPEDRPVAHPAQVHVGVEVSPCEKVLHETHRRWHCSPAFAQAWSAGTPGGLRRGSPNARHSKALGD